MIRELVTDGTTVLLTTQYLHEADALADRIVVIDRGQVVGAGTPGDLKARVGQVSIQLGFTDDATAQSAAGVLAGAGFAPERAGAHVHAPAAGGSGTVATVLRALDGRVADPDTVEIRQPTLEDVFAALTGRGRDIQHQTSARSVA
jgi:ABC-type multidrug transport system ATPase subunit